MMAFKSKIGRMKILPQIISRSELFKISYTPEEILERKETEDLYDELASFITYKNPNHVLIVGEPGTGKTLTANFIAKNMPRIEASIKTNFANCNGKTARQMLSILISGAPNTSLDEEEALTYYLTKTIQQDTLIILDEVDKGQKIYDLLYALSRPSELIPDFKHNISLLLISNNLYWEENLPSYIRSSLQLRKIPFHHYNEEQLRAIIDHRVHQGFLNKDAISDDLLNHITKKTVESRGGDCRVAIKTVFLAAKTAEQKSRNIIVELDVKNAFREAVREIESQRLVALVHNDFFVLLACFSKKEGLDNIYDEYKTITTDFNHKWKPVKSTKFFHIIDYLDSQGLVKKSINMQQRTEGPPKRYTSIKLNIDKTVVEKEVSKRFLKV